MFVGTQLQVIFIEQMECAVQRMFFLFNVHFSFEKGKVIPVETSGTLIMNHLALSKVYCYYAAAPLKLRVEFSTFILAKAYRCEGGCVTCAI